MGLDSATTWQQACLRSSELDSASSWLGLRDAGGVSQQQFGARPRVDDVLLVAGKLQCPPYYPPLSWLLRRPRNGLRSDLTPTSRHALASKAPSTSEDSCREAPTASEVGSTRPLLRGVVSVALRAHLPECLRGDLGLAVDRPGLPCQLRPHKLRRSPPFQIVAIGGASCTQRRPETQRGTGPVHTRVTRPSSHSLNRPVGSC